MCALITHVLIYLESLVGAGISEVIALEGQLPLPSDNIKSKSLGQCLPTHKICYSCLSQLEGKCFSPLRS